MVLTWERVAGFRIWVGVQFSWLVRPGPIWWKSSGIGGKKLASGPRKKEGGKVTGAE